MSDSARGREQDDTGQARKDQEREQAERALELTAQAGIHRLSIPTPFRVGRVNLFLIDDEPLTLLDVGPNSSKALHELEQGLAELGKRIEDLELLVITHQHLDHFGLTASVARRSGAEVAALHSLIPYMRDYEAEAEREDEFAQETMRRHGVPAELVDALVAIAASFRGFGESFEASRSLQDGEQLTLRDRTLQVLHRPGHSPTDTVLYDAERRMLLAGDHLIKHISSNAVITRPGSGGAQSEPSGVEHLDERPSSLLTYIESLKQTAAMDVELVLPGHGRLFGDHATLIDERLRMHDRRARKIAELIRQHPRSAHEIALELWGDVAVTEAYLTLSEVLGHIDLLLQAGEVTEADDGDVIRFHAT